MQFSHRFAKNSLKTKDGSGWIFSNPNSNPKKILPRAGAWPDFKPNQPE